MERFKTSADILGEIERSRGRIQKLSKDLEIPYSKFFDKTTHKNSNLLFLEDLLKLESENLTRVKALFEKSMT